MSKLLSIPTKALFLKEWIYIKKKIFPLSIGLALFGFFNVGLLIILPNLAEYLESIIPEITAEMSIQSFINSANSIISIIAVIMCADAIAGEKERNTLVLLQTKPIRVTSIIMVKISVRYILMIISTVISAIAVFLATYVFIGLPNFSDFIISLVVYLITIFTYLSIGIFISTIVKSQTSAGAISAAVILAITMLASLLTFSNFQPYNIFQMSVNLTTMEFPATNIALVCLVIIGIGIVFLALSILFYYNEKEPTRKK